MKEIAIVPQWSFDAITETMQNPECELGSKRKIVVSGVSCSGKDFLVPRANELLSENQRLPMYSGGTIASQVLGIPRDQLRYIEKQTVVDFQAMILGQLPESDYVFNGHYVTKHFDGTYIVNIDHLRQYHASHLIAVISEPQRIAQWRIDENAKGERVRDIESLARIHQHQQLILQTFRQVAEEQECGYTTIYNTPGDTEQNITLMAEIFAGEK